MEEISIVNFPIGAGLTALGFVFTMPRSFRVIRSEPPQTAIQDRDDKSLIHFVEPTANICRKNQISKA